jgi:hypothetical protein
VGKVPRLPAAPLYGPLSQPPGGQPYRKVELFRLAQGLLKHEPGALPAWPCGEKYSGNNHPVSRRKLIPYCLSSFSVSSTAGSPGPWIACLFHGPATGRSRLKYLTLPARKYPRLLLTGMKGLYQPHPGRSAREEK